MIAVRGEGTSIVRIVKALLFAPAGMLKLPGVGAATVGLVLDRVTSMPPAGAGHSSVTVPLTEFGPTTGFGLSARVCTPMGRTLKPALLTTPPAWAVTLPVWVADTATVEIEKVLLVAPIGTVTLAGTLAAARLSERETTTPPAGAAELSVTVPVRL
jgi:hypothetical protein